VALCVKICLLVVGLSLCPTPAWAVPPPMSSNLTGRQRALCNSYKIAKTVKERTSGGASGNGRGVLDEINLGHRLTEVF